MDKMKEIDTSTCFEQSEMDKNKDTVNGTYFN